MVVTIIVRLKSVVFVVDKLMVGKKDAKGLFFCFSSNL